MVHIGMGAFVPADKVIMILDLDSQSVQKYYQSLPENLKLSTCKGRKAYSLVVLSNGMVAKSILSSTALRERWLKNEIHRAGQGSPAVQDRERVSEICDDEA